MASRKRSGQRKKLIDQYANARRVDPKASAVKAVEAILKRAKERAEELGLDPVQGIGDLKGEALISFLDDVAEHSEALKEVYAEESNPGSSSGSAGKSRGVPGNRIEKELQDRFTSAGAKGLVSGPLADFIGECGDLETALESLEKLIADWEAKQATSQQEAIAEVVGDSQVLEPAPVVEQERFADALSMEEVDELRIKPCHRRRDAELEDEPPNPDGKELEPEAETVEPGPAESAPAPEEVGRCPFPISELYDEDCAPRPGRIFKVFSGSKWAPWLEDLFGGAGEQEMCNTCYDHLRRVLRMEDRAVRQELGKIGELIGRPFETCIVGLKGCEGVAPETIFCGGIPEIKAILIARNNGRDNAPACASCKGKLRDAARSYDKGGKKQLQAYLEELEIQIPAPTPEPVEAVKKEPKPVGRTTCEVCGVVTEEPEMLFVSTSVRVRVCHTCWTRLNPYLNSVLRGENPVSVLKAIVIEHFRFEIPRGVSSAVTAKARKGSLQDAAAYLATKLAERSKPILIKIGDLISKAAEMVDEIEAQAECGRTGCHAEPTEGPFVDLGHTPDHLLWMVGLKFCTKDWPWALGLVTKARISAERRAEAAEAAERNPVNTHTTATSQPEMAGAV